MPLPPLLHLPDEATYRQHFTHQYCQARIETHDGIRVYFQQKQFDHAFFESTDRRGAKDAFSWLRAKRMDWIGATLGSAATKHYQGWDAKSHRHRPNRRVDLLYEDFVVVLRLDLRKGGDLKANFVTCYQANNSGGRIRAAPLWRAADCINALRQKKGR